MRQRANIEKPGGPGEKLQGRKKGVWCCANRGSTHRTVDARKGKQTTHKIKRGEFEKTAGGNKSAPAYG